MPRIDHSNYEAWLLDRMEGNLTPDQERELDAFLLLHPDLAISEDGLPTVTGPADGLSWADKNALKRTLPPIGMVTDGSVEDHLIARLEGDLSAEQVDALWSYLVAHPEWQRAARIHEVARITPPDTTYPAKAELQRHLPPQGLPTPHTLQDLLIARAEGDLDPAQERAVAELLVGNAHHQRTWALVKAARIVPGTEVFADKAALKKKEGRVIHFAFRPLAAAATVALLLAAGGWFLRTPDDQDTRFANVPTTKLDPRPTTAQDEHPAVVPTPHDAAVEPQAVDASTPRTIGTRAQNRHHQDLPVTAHRTNEEEPARQVPERPMGTPALAQAPEPEQPEQGTSPVPLPVEPDPGPLASVDPAPADTRPARSVPDTQERTLAEALAGVLRERVLEAPARESAPLDRDDAVAAMDRTLKVVGGGGAGLEVRRKADGVVKGFDLRLGRNFSISAQR